MSNLLTQLNNKKASDKVKALKSLTTAEEFAAENRDSVIRAVLLMLEDSSVTVVRQALKTLQFLRLEKIPRELLVLAKTEMDSRITAQALALIRRIQIEEKIRTEGELEWKQEDYVFSVSDFVLYVNTLLDDEIAHVKGEVSDVKVFRDNFVFFSLKDKDAVINCWFPRAYQYKWNVELAEGIEIVIKGKPQVSPRSGKFALRVLEMQVSGEGSIKLALERLKERLGKEGLFDESRKRALPFLPEKVGLITGEDSAAYSDFIKVLSARMGGITIYFAPVRVQGVGSIAEICSAISWFNENSFYGSNSQSENSEADFPQIIVLTRGGGSLEDLQSFNSEEVTRAVFSSRIPIVVAVGHEKDWSLAEFAADLRASTPSNAAELIAPEKGELLVAIRGRRSLIEQNFGHIIASRTRALTGALTVIQGNLKHRLGTYSSIISFLPIHFSGFIRSYERKSQAFFRAQETVLLNFDKYYTLKRRKLAEITKLINSYSPKNTLKRGYSVVKVGASLVRSSRDVLIGEEITIYPYEGSIQSMVTKTGLK